MRRLLLWLLWLLLLVPFGIDHVLAQPPQGDNIFAPQPPPSNQKKCTICRDGQPVPEPHKIPWSGGGDLAGQTCQQIDNLVGLLYTDSNNSSSSTTTTECQFIQSLGTLCGCPPAPHACHLCPQEGNTVKNPHHQLPFWAQQFGGLPPTCETLQAFLASTPNSVNDPLCPVAQTYVADYCGCSIPPQPQPDKNDDSENGGNQQQEQEAAATLAPCSICSNPGDVVEFRNETIHIEGFPFETCGDLQDAAELLLYEGTTQCSSLKALGPSCGCPPTTLHTENACTLCRDGNPTPLPHNPMPQFQRAFGGFVPTCSLVDSSLSLLTQGTDECEAVQLMGSVCGCAEMENSCRYCPEFDEIPPAYADTTIPDFHYYFGDDVMMDPTCSNLWPTQYQIPHNDERCDWARLGSFLCGCNGGTFAYYGANTPTKKRVLAYMPTVSATLSILGSLAIMYDVIHSKTRRTKVYNRIVFLMSCADIVASTAMAFSTLPTPPDSYVYGSSGTTTTCKAQGFFIQFMEMSLFYNLMLSTYFYLTLGEGWPEQRLRQIQYWMYIVPAVVGLAMAIAGLPYYTNVRIFCYVDIPPLEDTWWPALVFYIIPNLFVTVMATIMMVRVYLRVRHQTRRMSRWEFRSSARFSTGGTTDSGQQQQQQQQQSKKLRLDRQVFWQAVLYLSAFYATYTAQVYTTFQAWASMRRSDDTYAMFLLVVILTPLQGFWNAFIYFRPRWMQRVKSRGRRRRSRRWLLRGIDRDGLAHRSSDESMVSRTQVEPETDKTDLMENDNKREGAMNCDVVESTSVETPNAV